MSMLDELVNTNIVNNQGNIDSTRDTLLMVAELLNRDIVDGACMYINPFDRYLFVRRESPYYVGNSSGEYSLQVYGTKCSLTLPDVYTNTSISLSDFRLCLPVEKEDELKVLSAIKELHYLYANFKLLALDTRLTPFGIFEYENMKQLIEDLQLYNEEQYKELFNKYNIQLGSFLKVDSLREMLLHGLGDSND